MLSEKRTDESYCRISGFASVNLGVCPYIHCFDDPEKAQENITSILKCFTEPDVCFISSNGNWFDHTEEEAVAKTFGDIPAIKPKTIFGETLGCGYMMNATAAACCIQKDDYSRILATGIDMIGNYTCVMLESSDR